MVLLAEILLGRHKDVHTAHDNRVLFWCAASGLAIARPLSALLIAWTMTWLLPQWRGALAGIPLLPAFLAGFVATEFCFYWAHRWAHEAASWQTPWLWLIHRTHHSARYMSVLVTLRINFFWAFIVPTPWVLGLMVYLGQEFAAALVLVTIYGWNLITHADFRWDDPIRRHLVFGPAFRALEHILVSPGMHHSHHGYGKNGGNFRNYAVTLSLIDWLFGTLFIPTGRPWRYGVPGKDPYWVEEVFYPLVKANTAEE